MYVCLHARVCVAHVCIYIHVRVSICMHTCTICTHVGGMHESNCEQDACKQTIISDADVSTTCITSCSLLKYLSLAHHIRHFIGSLGEQ